jgi:hypothetical protein
MFWKRRFFETAKETRVAMRMRALFTVVLPLLVHCGREGVLSPSGSDETAPGMPTGLAVYRARDGEIDFVWDNNRESNIAGYKVYRTQTNPSGTYRFIAETGENGYSDRGLDYDTTYFYRVTAYNTVGIESAPSDSVWGIPHNMYAPDIPQDLVAHAHNDEGGISITLMWIPNTEGDLAGYKIYRSIGGDVIPSEASFHDTTSTVPYSDVRSVRIGTRYSYRIVAFDRGGWQSVASAVTLDVVLQRPQLVSPPANATLVSTPTFQWKSVADANSYLIFVSTAKYSSEIWSATVNPTGDSTASVFYAGPLLYSGRTYYWKIGTVTNDEQDPNSLSETRMFLIGTPELKISGLRDNVSN